MVKTESGGAPGEQTYNYPEASQVLAGGLYLWDGVTNRALAGGVKLDYGIELTEVEGIHGVHPNGIQGYVLSARKIRVSLEPAYQDNDLWDLFRNPPASSVLTAWWGRGANAWGFCLPQAMQVKPPDKVGKENVSRLNLVFGAAKYSGDTGAGSDATAINKSCVIGQLAG
jgi:hypothetical protein